MLREIKEELNFVPKGYFYLGKYNSDYSVSDYYAVEVYDNFEQNIKIGEGDYGEFFSEQNIENEFNLSQDSKLVLKDLIKKVRKT